ncbi:3-hydroxyacyl-CoA dehydrogenase family protein [Ascidiaceihabitans sp.]|uniref:3-hydroxyacyl-CoA dehydrogenase family protein n=1 Tax=Ascidiaceihabitans sp. TaxID=1872644 RepID=UPI0032991DF1
MTSELSQVEDVLWAACDTLLWFHTNPWELDEALVGAGFLVGPLEVQDHVGLLHVLKRRNAYRSPVLPRMVAEGRIGKIGGVGFYRYPGGGGAVIDPLMEDLILEEAHFAKVTRTPMSDAEIVHSVLTPVSVFLREKATDPIAVARQLQINVDDLTDLLAQTAS